MDPLDPALLERDDVRTALAARDVGAVYRLLWRAGVSQRRIAQLTGESQPEVCEILRGRKVRDVWVLERIADGLGAPRAWMGLGYGEDGPDALSADEDLDEEMKRRALIAAATAAALGQLAPGVVGEPIEVALPAGQVLPSRLGRSHVHAVRAVTDRLVGVARYYGGQADLFGATAKAYTRWMQVPAAEEVKARLAPALAELHTSAGWCCHDRGDLQGRLRHLGRRGDAGPQRAPQQCAEAVPVGAVPPRRGFRKSTPATPRADDPRVPTLTARLSRQSATAYAVMGGPDEATRSLAEAHDGWEPRDGFERAGMELATAGVQLDLGQFGAAEQFAASAVRSYGENHHRGRTLAELLLAEVHIRAGEPQGLSLARDAIEGVSTLQSVAVRRERLIPLATALEARPGSDTQDLAQITRQIATTRI